MTRFINYFLCSCLLLLVACSNAEKEFMTPKQGEVVLDVRADAYSLNAYSFDGKVIDRSFADFSTDVLVIDSNYNLLADSLHIVIDSNYNLWADSLHKDLKMIRENLGDEVLQILTLEDDSEKRKQIHDDYPLAKIHYDDDVTYDVFYSSYLAVSFIFDSFQLAFGSNYKEIYWLHEPHTRYYVLFSFWCQQLNDARISDFLFGTNRVQEMIADHNIRDADVQWCAAADTSVLLTFYRKNEGYAYAVSLNKTGGADGYEINAFDKEEPLWEFIEKTLPTYELPNKTRYAVMVLRVQKDILIKDVVPFIKKLMDYGYQIKFDEIK